jgi:hypothetical protein
VRKLSVVRVATAGVAALALLVLMLLGASGHLTGTAGPVEHGANQAIAGGRLPVSTMGDSARTPDGLALGPNAAPRVGLDGDEVSPALATYSIDRDGNLFEVHSPQTEEPRLGPPMG